MQKLIEEFIEDKGRLKAFKALAVSRQQYELAAALRGVELEKFPETKAIKSKIHEAQMLKRAMAMVDLKTDDKSAFIVLRLLKAISDKENDFDLKTATKITVEADNIFGE